MLQCYLWFIRKVHNDHESTIDLPNDQDLETILKDENSPDDRRERKGSQYEPKTPSRKTSLLSRFVNASSLCELKYFESVPSNTHIS